MNPKDDGKSAAGWTGRDWTPQGERLYVGGRPQGAEERGIAALAADSGHSLERELLLADGVADPREASRPAPARRTGWLVGLTLGLVGAALAATWMVRERREWDVQRTRLEGDISKLSTDSRQLIDGLNKESSRRELVIAERKSENQNLASLLQKALGQIETAQSDLRHERERNEKLVAEHQKALAAAQARASVRSPLAETLSTWLPRWVRAVEDREKVEAKKTE